MRNIASTWAWACVLGTETWINITAAEDEDRDIYLHITILPWTHSKDFFVWRYGGI